MSFHLLPLIQFFIVVGFVALTIWLWSKQHYIAAFVSFMVLALMIIFRPLKLDQTGDTQAMRSNESLEVFNRKREVEDRVVVKKETFEERQAREKALLTEQADAKAEAATDEGN